MDVVADNFAVSSLPSSGSRLPDLESKHAKVMDLVRKGLEKRQREGQLDAKACRVLKSLQMRDRRQQMRDTDVVADRLASLGLSASEDVSRPSDLKTNLASKRLKVLLKRMEKYQNMDLHRRIIARGRLELLKISLKERSKALDRGRQQLTNTTEMDDVTDHLTGLGLASSEEVSSLSGSETFQATPLQTLAEMIERIKKHQHEELTNKSHFESLKLALKVPGYALAAIPDQLQAQDLSRLESLKIALEDRVRASMLAAVAGQLEPEDRNEMRD